MKFITGMIVGIIVTVLVLGATICMATGNIDVTDLWNNVYDSTAQTIRIQGV